MRVVAYGPSDAEALIRFFDRDDQGFCYCRYWSFDGPNAEWIASEASAHRAAAAEEPTRLGVVVHAGPEVAGWMRLARTDDVPKLHRLGLESAPAPGAASVLCMSVATELRGQGLAREMLERAIAELAAQGFSELRAYPRSGDAAEPGHVWTGPRGLYERSGFTLVREAQPRCTMRRALG